MTRYLVTGATGFIGRHLTELLLARGGTVYALVRESSRARLDSLREHWAGGERVVPLSGDLESPLLGVARETLSELHGTIDHFFHLAALYDMTASEHQLESANVRGTWHAVQLANSLQVGRFHHVSSIAAAGRYRGVFTEQMFEEATGLDDPYFRTKHASEAVVRRECRAPWRVYRPGIVVGHSVSGEMDKVDGPYYFFGLLQRLAAALPSGLPLVGVDNGAQLNLVPVDFVARAMDHIAHAEDLDGRAFHLVDPEPRSFVEALDLFAKTAGGPRFAITLGSSVGERLTSWLGGPLGHLTLRAAGALAGALFDVPPRLVGNLDWPTRFDASGTRDALAGSGIEVPCLESYAAVLWNYWENELHADTHCTPALVRAARGRRVLITGASSGIGRAAALELGAAGARVLLVARSRERLDRIAFLIEQSGGEAHVYPADLSSSESCDLLAKRVLDEQGGVDILVNNAGRSIRRALDLSYERFHDYERTMALNYFGALKLTLHFLPGMRQRGDGHVVNVSSMGVQTGEPRFTAYVASKAALDAFSRAASGELFGDGVAITTIYMPLVRTPMSTPTQIYNLLPELTSSQAAEWISRAIIERPARMALPGASLVEVARLVAPTWVDAGMNALYRVSQPDASAASAQRALSGALREVARRLPGPFRRLARPAPTTAQEAKPEA